MTCSGHMMSGRDESRTQMFGVMFCSYETTYLLLDTNHGICQMLSRPSTINVE